VEEQSAYYAVDVEEAAARLQQPPDRVREMLATGELEGIPPGATAQGDWKVLLPASPHAAADLEVPAPAAEPPDPSPPEEEQEEVPPQTNVPRSPLRRPRCPLRPRKRQPKEHLAEMTRLLTASLPRRLDG
jgi:hypothetical protein